MIVVNKTDLVNKERLEEVIRSVKSVNSASKIVTTIKSKVDLDLLLDSQIFQKP